MNRYSDKKISNQTDDFIPFSQEAREHSKNHRSDRDKRSQSKSRSDRDKSSSSVSRNKHERHSRSTTSKSLSKEKNTETDRQSRKYRSRSRSKSQSPTTSHRFYNNNRSEEKELDRIGSIFNRLGGCEDRNLHYKETLRSPIVYDLKEEDNRRAESSSSSYGGIFRNNDNNFQNFNIVIRTDNNTFEHNRSSNGSINEEVIQAIRYLENEQREIIHHCNGLRSTIDLYYKEISKLEFLISRNYNELNFLRRKLML